MNIAIDGPAGAGKSTVAQIVADRLGYIYIDTGAMYRALTWKALEQGTDLHSDQELTGLLAQLDIRLVRTDHGQKVYVHHEDITKEIRLQEVGQSVSLVASHPGVRRTMVNLQRELADNQCVVMDGRDIGTHVLPQAGLKIYLTASIEERAQRRFEEQQRKGFSSNMEATKKEIALRDQQDQNRKTAPLKKADDAVLVDTTGLSVEQVVHKIIALSQMQEKQGE